VRQTTSLFQVTRPLPACRVAWGVFHVSAIDLGVVIEGQQIGSNGSHFYADDGPGGSTGQITGIFYGLQTTSPTTWTGGTIDLFWHAANAPFIDGNCISGTTCKPDATAVGMFTSGTFIARLKFASGSDPTNAVTFRISDVPFTTVSNTGGRVVFSSFANVDTSTTLAWTNPLDRDFFNTSFGTLDVRLMIFANSQSTWSGTGSVGLRGNDPITVFTR
jgi:hypothetical protein